MPDNKPLGGRGKKEPYTSYVVRLPDILKPQVDKLLDTFHASRSKHLTGSIYQLPASLLCDLMKTRIPVNVDDWCLSVTCSYPRHDQDYDNNWYWNDEWDKEWTEKELPKIERLYQLADEVNRCIWQIDNSFSIQDPDEVRTATELLVEYGLVEMDNSTPPAGTKALFDWVSGKPGCRTCFSEAMLDAFEEERFDMLTALEIGLKHPVDRRQYWKAKYTEQLAKTNINYWSWLPNPESKEICPELSHLLELPKASPDARMVLQCLAEGKDPFYKPEPKSNGGFSYNNLSSRGELADYSPEMKKQFRQAFTEWHKDSLSRLGQELLTSIYKVVFGTSWDLVESIITTMTGDWWEVLQVSHLASAKEVKAAYRRMASIWHPDINSSPKAPEYMSKINRAFEQYENRASYKYR